MPAEIGREFFTFQVFKIQ